MQVILQECLSEELIARQKFFYETFHLWLIVSSNNDSYIQLSSLPTNCLDILFIVGHNVFVKNFYNTIRLKRKESLPSHVMARFIFLPLNFLEKLYIFLIKTKQIMQIYLKENSMVLTLILQNLNSSFIILINPMILYNVLR